MIEKGQKRLDSVAYPASRSCVGPQTSAAHEKNARWWSANRAFYRSSTVNR